MQVTAPLLRSLLTALLGGLAAAVFLGGARPLGAQEPEWSPEIDKRACALVALEWGLPVEAVVMEWGPAPRHAPGPAAEVELVGSGRGGYWVARVSEQGQPPMSVRVRAGHKATRSVATRRIERGDTLSVTDMGVQEWTVWGAPSALSEIVMTGWVAQRVIQAGAPLESPAVRAPLAVVSGTPVSIVWQRGSVGVRVRATASGSGALGDRIFVRTEAGRRLEGVIVAPGVVNVTTGSGDGPTGAEQ